MILLFRRLRPAAVPPSYMTAGAAGMDLASAADGPVTLAPGARAMIGTGLAIEIPAGFEGQVRARSGLARKYGIAIVNAPGTIDSDYRGELCVLLINLGTVSHTIEPGDRIAQLVIAPVTRVELAEATELTETERGVGGFGHTG